MHDKVSQSLLQRYEQERLEEMESELERKQALLRLEERRLRAAWEVEDAERLARVKLLQVKVHPPTHPPSHPPIQS